MTSPQKLHMAKCQKLNQSLGKLRVLEKKQKTANLEEKKSIVTMRRIQGLFTHSLPLEITNFI